MLVENILNIPLALAFSVRPKFLTIRLSQPESKHLVLLTSVKSMDEGKHVTTKDYLAWLVIEAARNNVSIPQEKSIPVLSNNSVAKRNSLAMSPEMYVAIDKLRGYPAAVLVGAEVEVRRIGDYGDADLVRELIDIEYRKQVRQLRNRHDSDNGDDQEPEPAVARPRPR